MADDYPLIGPPSIDLRTFQAVLTSAGSPMAGEAPAIYASVRAKGVDPAVILAIAQRESSFGKAGIAVGRNNPFGSRYYAGTSSYGAVNRGGWAAFPTYAAAASYTAGLLASKSYAGAGLTARTFPTRYAPASDGNAPAAYGSAVVNAINRWTGSPPAAGPKPAPAAPAAPAAPKATPAATGPAWSLPAALGILGLLAILLAFVLVR